MRGERKDLERRSIEMSDLLVLIIVPYSPTSGIIGARWYRYLGPAAIPKKRWMWGGVDLLIPGFIIILVWSSNNCLFCTK